MGVGLLLGRNWPEQASYLRPQISMASPSSRGCEQRFKCLCENMSTDMRIDMGIDMCMDRYAYKCVVLLTYLCCHQLICDSHASDKQPAVDD